MAITRWDPFREVVALQNRVNSLFRDFNEGGEGPLTTASFVPAVDIYEDEKKVVLKLEVPGMEEKDLDIRVENHTSDGEGRAQVREGREGRELPSHRAALRELLPGLHASVDRGYRERGGKLQCWRAEAGADKKPEAQPKQIKVNVAGTKAEERELVGAR